MDNQLNVQDLLGILRQYKDELANALEAKMIAKSLLDKQIKINQELLKQIAEMKQQEEKVDEDVE